MLLGVLTLSQVERYEKSKFFLIKILENIDLIFCFGMLFTGFAIIYLSYKFGIGQYGLGFALSLDPIGYYFLKKKVDFKNKNIDCLYNQDERINDKLFFITNIVFWICFTLSIAILYNVQYIRPPLYFILVTLAFFAIFLEIFNIKNNGKWIYFIILKTLLISLSFRVGRYYSFPTISGADTHFHLMFANSIIANGKILATNADKYYFTPLWHIFEAINSIILNVNLKDTLFISSIAVSAVVISLFAYLIAEKLFNVRIGLIAFLFVNIADMLFVGMVTNINTSLMVIIFFIITMFCLIRTKYLFSWDKIPGKDDGKLIEFLTLNFGIDWVRTAKTDKIDDGKTIKITSGRNFLSLRLNDKKNNVNLEINDIRTDEFIVKVENGELNIYQTKNRIIYSFFVILLIFESIITHQLSTFVFFIIIIIFAISEFSYLQLYSILIGDKKTHYNPSTSITLIVYFTVLLITYWMNMGHLGSRSFFDNMINRLYLTFTDMFTEYASSGAAPSTAYENMVIKYSTISNLMFNLGYSILFGLAIIGLLVLLNSKYRSIIIFQYICASIFLFTLIYPGTYIGLDLLLIPHRFLPFFELFLIIFAAFSVYLIFEIKIIKWNKICISIIVLGLIFFMITTPFINRNDAIYSKDQVYVTDYTYSELTALEWVADHQNNKPLSVDPIIDIRPLSTVEELNVSGVQIEAYPINLNKNNMPLNVFVRQYIINNPDMIISGTFGITKDIHPISFIEVISENYNLIYSFNSGYIYQKDEYFSNV
ncbi:MAG: hypothetical protein C3F06_13055 [Candidatus Methanoperedenaceae archaeon]|nr:MAG: hypothetical protein C3F06_13055 [Candidatus Methanoperedenaceae archaeon]